MTKHASENNRLEDLDEWFGSVPPLLDFWQVVFARREDFGESNGWNNSSMVWRTFIWPICSGRAIIWASAMQSFSSDEGSRKWWVQNTEPAIDKTFRSVKHRRLALHSTEVTRSYSVNSNPSQSEGMTWSAVMGPFPIAPLCLINTWREGRDDRDTAKERQRPAFENSNNDKRVQCSKESERWVTVVPEILSRSIASISNRIQWMKLSIVGLDPH